MTSNHESQSNDKPAGKGGAPPRNKNGLRHGLRSSQLPKGSKGITTALDTFRLALETAVIAMVGRQEISVKQAGLIQSALRFERSALLAERWLRTEADDLTPAEKLRFMKAATDATTARDRCIEKLGIDDTPTSGQSGTTMIAIPHIPTEAS